MAQWRHSSLPDEAAIRLFQSSRGRSGTTLVHGGAVGRRTVAGRGLGVGLKTMNPAIQLDDLTVCYNRHPAVHHLSGAFHRGSLTAIVGPNGAGKSTLIKAIMAISTQPPEKVKRVQHPASFVA
jgi:ABC-type multidrug transport system fused ATPase/permease subunit